MPSESNSSTSRELPAWLTSVGLHAVLLVVAFLWLGREPQGAADEPGRQVGIVLKRATDDGPVYENPLHENHETTPNDSAQTEQSPTDATLTALPAADVTSHFEKHLPKAETSLQGIGVESLTGAATAQQMTSGGRGQPANLSGSAATTSIFGVEGTGHKFVYAFDRSVSMNGARLAAAKRELLGSLESLAATHQFQIVFFNHRLTIFDIAVGQGRIAFADDRNKELARRFVGGIIADGGTDRYAALRRALAMEPDVVFFLTDADDPMTPAEMGQIAQLNRRVAASVCTIEFGRGPKHGKQNFLVQLASMTGWQYGYVDTTRLAR